MSGTRAELVTHWEADMAKVGDVTWLLGTPREQPLNVLLSVTTVGWY